MSLVDDLADRAARELMGKVLMAKARCYRATFLDGEAPGHDQSRVLADLERFCRGRKTTFREDPYLAARLAGRREVWLRIQEYLNLDDAQVRKLVEVESDYDVG